MNDGKIIIDKIIERIEEENNAILAEAQKDVDAILDAAEDKAAKERMTYVKFDTTVLLEFFNTSVSLLD